MSKAKTTKQMHTPMPELLLQRLDAAARHHGRSRANLVRRIITQWLDNQEDNHDQSN